MKKVDFLKRVTTSLQKAGEGISKTSQEKRKSCYRSELNVLALAVPIQRKISQQGFSLEGLDELKILSLWDYIWKKSPIFEVKAQALLYYQYRIKNLSPAKKFWPILSSWSEEIENWEHSDRLSHIHSSLLEQDFYLVYPTLAKWNCSEHSWQRRLSVVNLLYYSSLRKSYPPAKAILTLVEALLLDQEYYVQKGVGWTLREAGNVFPEEAENFINKHLHSLSSIAFTTAIEKIDKKQKEEWKNLRKAERSRKKK